MFMVLILVIAIISIIFNVVHDKRIAKLWRQHDQAVLMHSNCEDSIDYYLFKTLECNRANDILCMKESNNNLDKFMKLSHLYDDSAKNILSIIQKD